ncbi:TPA: hypothetical protein NJ192_003952 [Vibrio parahaemolyticus]|nr:hypothetical protein [Vibrio parahaemolyticus]
MLLEKLPPESTFLLACLLRDFGTNAAFEIRVEDIVKSYFSTRNTVSKLLKNLESEGCLERRKTRNFQGKGAGPSQYFFTDKMRAIVQSTSFLKEVCESQLPAVKKIIEVELCECGGNQKVKLRSSHRLFLLILILRSDEMGVVSDLSSADISKLMGGASKDKLRSQLKFLKKHRFIRDHVSGTTGRKLFGKVKGKYYLDVFHPVLEGSYPGISRLTLHANNFISQGNMTTEAEALFEMSQRKERMEESSNWDRLIFIDDFCGYVGRKAICDLLTEKSLRDYFQLKLFEAASIVLSESWNDLNLIHKAIQSFSPNILLGRKQTARLMAETFEQLKQERCFTLTSEKEVTTYLENQIMLKLGGKPPQSKEIVKLWSNYIDLVFVLSICVLGIAARYKMLLTYSFGPITPKSVQIVPRYKHKRTLGRHVETFEVMFWSEQYAQQSTLTVTGTNTSDVWFELICGNNPAKEVELFEGHVRDQIMERINQLLLPLIYAKPPYVCLSPKFIKD